MAQNQPHSKLDLLRQFMHKERIEAYIIPNSDPHLSEYPSTHWQELAYFSNFTGSAGTLVVTLTEAGLWTDSRYFLQAEEQLQDTGITLYKEGLPDTPSIMEFLVSHVKPYETIGMNPNLSPFTDTHDQKETLHPRPFTEIDTLPGYIWPDRPALPESKAYIYPLEYAGESTGSKLRRLRETMQRLNVEKLFTSSLDEIAWVLNLRGSDIDYNPVNICHLLVSQGHCDLFITEKKLTTEVREYLDEQQVHIHPYETVDTFLLNSKLGRCLADLNKTNYKLGQLIVSNATCLNTASPISALKAEKNTCEIAGIHDAMTQDGVALVRFLKWLESAVTSGQETELSVEQKLHDFRAEHPLYKGDSFRTIAGYKGHGAIVHYEADPTSNATLRPEGFLLLDSGGQYLNGTTDITRTIALGPLNEEEKRDYTLVLKGHIALARAVFPAGTTGHQLDILARLPLWQDHKNYLHGTGHGVGHFLNVHEGPQSIRLSHNPIALKPHMVTSNEPGIYVTGKHGIRIENLVLVNEAGPGMFTDYYEFETLTLCPICTKGIIHNLLTQEEKDWLNSYHEKVYQTLEQYLTDDERLWLRTNTLPI